MKCEQGRRAMLPNGKLLFARDEEESGGVVIACMKGTRRITNT